LDGRDETLVGRGEVLELVERDDQRPDLRCLVSHELKGVRPRGETQRRHTGDDPAALPREGLEVEGARLLLGLKVHDSLSGERDAQKKRLADTPAPSEDHEDRRIRGQFAELTDLTLAINHLY